MSVESSSRELFDLINLATFDKSISVQSAAFTESRNFIYGLIISSNKKLNFCHIPKHRKEDKLREDNLLPTPKTNFGKKELSESFKLQQLEWFSHESMRAKAAAFNPLGDYCLVVTENMDLYVICVERIVSGTEVMGKASSGLSWNREVVSQVYRAVPGPDSGDGVTAVLGAPSCLLWWETSDFIQLGIVGTDTGNLVVINLVSGTMLSHCLVKGSVSRLEVMVDSALDCVNLLVTTDTQQWRVLVEQRSTGYVWGCAGDIGTCHVPPSPQQTRANGHSNEGDDTGAVQRTRLQSIKQMSVDRITNLRNRLAEGRKMLKSRSECEEVIGGGQARVECITQDTGSSKLSVQTDTSGHRYFMAGLALDTSLMTIHDTDVDSPSERAATAFYKLPPASSRLIINGKLIISSSHSSSPELSSQISVSSAVMSESKPQSQSFKQESVLQSFTLQPGEQILHLSSVEIFQPLNLNSESSSKKLENGATSQISKSPFRKLVCVTTNDKGEKEKTVVERNKSSTPCSDSSGSNKSGLFGGLDLETKDISQQLSSSQKSVFEQKTVASLEAIKTKYSAMMGAGSGYVIVTDRNVYIMRMTQDPIDMFLSCVMQSRMRESEVMARCFGLEKAALVELAGDIRLYQGDISSAVSLYRQAGTKHVKTALKLAASGNVAELLSFLQAVFSSQNIEISAADRVHLSNLSLMCQFHQLCSSSHLSKYYFEEKLFFFLKCNRWYDSGLAVRQCVEAGAWKLVTGLTQHLGLEAEVGAGLVLYNIEEIIKTASQETRQEIIGLLLLPHLLPSLLDSPGAGQTLAGLLKTCSNDLSSSQLNTLLHNTCPARRDLQPLFVVNGRLEDQGDELRMFRKGVIELFLSLCLILVKRKQDHGSQTLFDKSLLGFHTRDSVNDSDNDGTEMSDVQLSCGYNHSLYKCPGGELVSWGAAGEARLGQGRLTSPTAAPGLIHLFRSLGLTVTAVTAGKQHSLALTRAGLFSWGCNKYGQLGLGLASTSLASCAYPRHVPGLQDIRVTHVSSGQFHSACLDSDGRVYTWGWGVHGQLGHGGVDDVLSPQLVTGLRRCRVIQVSCGYAHTVALTSKGHVFTWGCGLFGQLGTGTTDKHVRPVRLSMEAIRGRVTRITAGYFHNIAMMDSGELVTWGANPQILRLEAQQRKKEKLLMKQLEESRRQAEACVEAGEASSEQEMMMSLHPQDSNTTSSDLHLSPSVLDTSMIAERIVSVAAGSQHTALVTGSGKLFTYGRNLEGQLGLGNRQSVKVPAQVTALGENRVTMLGAGADFTVAVTDSGTVFAWGSNAAGQLGRAPLEDPGSGAGPGTDNSRVLVMKTTKRIIRLQHGLQNSCDVPRPVQGLTKMRDDGIYAENGDTVTASVSAGEFYSEYSLHKKFPSIEPVFSSRSLLQFLHLTLELFHFDLDSEELLRQCLILENPLAAAKISLLCEKYLQAFDLAIQAIMRHGKQTDEHLLDTFLYYMSLERAERKDKVGMFERLVCCWQDQGLSFNKLESFLLETRDPSLLNIIIITLFCPQPGDKLSAHGVDGPNKRTLTDIQLVDLFSPEFNLKIGDLFSKSASEMNPPLECAKEMSESEGFGSKLECIVSECLDRDIIQ